MALQFQPPGNCEPLVMNRKEANSNEKVSRQPHVSQKHSASNWTPTKFDCDRFWKTCWKRAIPIAIQSWGRHEPEYPGHDSGGPASAEYRTIRLEGRALLLCKVTGTEDSDGISLCGNYGATPEGVKDGIDSQGLEGWSLKLLAEAIPGKDQRGWLVKTINQFYSPLPGSDVGAEMIVNAAAHQRVECSYLSAVEGKVRLSAIGGFQTGVTTGSFVYDENLAELLNTVGIKVERANYVAASPVAAECVKILVVEAKKKRQHQYLNQLESRLRDADREVEQLRSQIKMQRES